MDIVAVLNADMIGYSQTTAGTENVIVFDRDSSNWIANVAANVSAAFNLDLEIHEYGAGANSDHWPFVQQGYDAVFFHEFEFNDYYHSPEDTVDHMDVTYDTRVTQLIVGTLVTIANVEIADTEPPELNLERPGAALYIADREIAPLEHTVIIGKITIEVAAVDTLSGIDRIEVYVDDHLKTTVMHEPYTWLWNEVALFWHRIDVTAFDNKGNEASDTVTVTIFNL
jgi:hypothetical protein